MARSDDNTVLLVTLGGLGLYLFYKKAQDFCGPNVTGPQCVGNYLSYLFNAYSPFQLPGQQGPNPGLVPLIGAGGTQGGGPEPSTTGTPPQIQGAGTSGVPVCVDNQTGEHFPTNPDGSCPVGSTLTLAVNVTQ